MSGVDGQTNIRPLEVFTAEVPRENEAQDASQVSDSQVVSDFAQAVLNNEGQTPPAEADLSDRTVTQLPVDVISETAQTAQTNDLPQGNGSSTGASAGPVVDPAGWSIFSGLQTATGVVVMLGSSYKTYQEVMKFFQTPTESDNGFAQKAYQFKNNLLDHSRIASSENEPSVLRTALYGGLTAVGAALILKA